MGLFSKDIKSLDALFLHVLQDIYYAEKQIAKTLPSFKAKASTREIAGFLRDDLAVAEKHASRLEQAFVLLAEKPKGTSCPAIDGILKEAKDITGESDKKVLDAALLAAARAIKHYQIARYSTLVAWADELAKEAVSKLLSTTLAEVVASDKAAAQPKAKRRKA